MKEYSPKLIIEILINEKLCNESKNKKLNKAYVCDQLSRQLKRRLNEDDMIFVINVTSDDSKILDIRFHNHSHLKLFKKDIDAIKKTIAEELGSFIENPDKKIVANQIKDKDSGGALLSLLTQQDSALARKDSIEEREADKSESVKAHYAQIKSEYAAFKRCTLLNKLLTERVGDDFRVFLNLANNPFIDADKVLCLSYQDDLFVWFAMDEKEDVILDTALFLRGMAGESFIEAMNHIKITSFQNLDANEYAEPLDYRIGFTSNEALIREWADEKVQLFIERLCYTEDGEPKIDIDNGYTHILNGSWQETLISAVIWAYYQESNKARNIVLQKIISI